MIESIEFMGTGDGEGVARKDSSLLIRFDGGKTLQLDRSKNHKDDEVPDFLMFTHLHHDHYAASQAHAKEHVYVPPLNESVKLGGLLVKPYFVQHYDGDTYVLHIEDDTGFSMMYAPCFLTLPYVLHIYTKLALFIGCGSEYEQDRVSMKDEGMVGHMSMKNQQQFLADIGFNGTLKFTHVSKATAKRLGKDVMLAHDGQKISVDVEKGDAVLDTGSAAYSMKFSDGDKDYGKFIDELKEFHKAKVYVENPEDVPEGAQTRRGPRGGTFYESEGAEEKSKEDEFDPNKYEFTAEESKEYGNLYWQVKWGKATLEEEKRFKELRDKADDREDFRLKYEEKLKRLREGDLENTKRLIREDKPYMVTQNQFIAYHKTGEIPSDAYKDYSTREGIAWMGKRDKYPILHSKIKIDGKEIELRRSGEKLKYVKVDENGEVVRDKEGHGIYYSDEELKEKRMPLTSCDITAFQGDDPIASVNDEFGATGVYVIDDFQHKGLGVYLLSEYRKLHPTGRIGQMTYAGEKMTRAYHKKLVRDALKEGKPVPPNVLKDYPDFVSGGKKEVRKATRIYVTSPADAPEGTQLKRGTRGGVYYEVGARKEKSDENTSKRASIMERINEIRYGLDDRYGAPKGAIPGRYVDEYHKLEKTLYRTHQRMGFGMARDAKTGDAIKIKATRAGKKGIFFSDLPDKAFGEDISEETLEFKNPVVYKNQAEAYTAFFGEDAYKKMKAKKPEVSWATPLEEQVKNKAVREWWDRVDKDIIKEAMKRGHDGIVYHHGRVYCDGEYVDLRGYTEEMHKASVFSYYVRGEHTDINKARIYVDSPSEAPEGVQLKRGTRGGVYYEVARREVKPHQEELEIPIKRTEEKRSYKKAKESEKTIIYLPKDEKELPEEIDTYMKWVEGWVQSSDLKKGRVEIVVMGKNVEPPLEYKTREGSVQESTVAGDADYANRRIRIYDTYFYGNVVFHELGHIKYGELFVAPDVERPYDQIGYLSYIKDLNDYDKIVEIFEQNGLIKEGKADFETIRSFHDRMWSVGNQFTDEEKVIVKQMRDNGLQTLDNGYEAVCALMDRVAKDKPIALTDEDRKTYKKFRTAAANQNKRYNIKNEWDEIWEKEGHEWEYANRNAGETFAQFFYDVMDILHFKGMYSEDVLRKKLGETEAKNPKKYAFFKKYVFRGQL